MNYKDVLYWITRLDGIHNTGSIFMVLFGLGLICFVVVAFCMASEDYEWDDMKKPIWVSVVGFVLNLCICLFVPTTKEALLITGVGETLNAVMTNETVKQIPDKAVLAIDKYLDEVLNDETETDD